MALQAPDVVGPGEARAIIGVSRATFMRHLDRPDFPPAARLACGLVFERRAIVAYAKTRETGKPYLRAFELYREHRTLAHVAAHLEISSTTARRYLQQLGEIER